MDRIDDPTAEADLFGAGKDGFQEGDPGLVDPTRVPAAWLNGVQEEIVRAIEDGGLTPDGNDLGQLSSLLKAYRASAHYEITGTDVDNGSIFELTSIFASTGFTLASNEVQVPTAGLYLIELSAFMSSNVVTDPTELAVAVQVGGADRAAANQFRHSAITGSGRSLSLSYVRNIATPSSEKIRVRSLQNDMNPSAIYASQLHIYRLAMV